MQRLVLFCLIIWLCPSLVKAEPARSKSSCTLPLQVHAFENRPWIPIVIADPRDFKTQILAYTLSEPFEYSIDRGTHKLWDVSLGTQIPILTIDHGEENGTVGKGCWGLQVGFQIGFLVVEDLTDPSDPILDAEYAFGPEVKFVYSLSERDLVGTRVRLLHRSAHVGDEFLLNAQEVFPGQVKRVDINYEFVQISGSWEHQLSRATLSQQLGFLATVNSQGFYTNYVRGTGRIQSSARNFEPSYSIQFTPTGDEGWRPLASFHLSLDSILNYAKQGAAGESSQLSSSVMGGLRKLGRNKPLTPDFVFRYYYGLNPYGQFRKQVRYRQIAVGLNLSF